MPDGHHDSVATMVAWGYDPAIAQHVLSVAVGIDADERIMNAMWLEASAPLP